MSPNLLEQGWNASFGPLHEIVFESGFYKDVQADKFEQAINCDNGRSIAILPPFNPEKDMKYRLEYDSSRRERFCPAPLRLGKMCSLTATKISDDIKRRWETHSPFFKENEMEVFRSVHKLTQEQISFIDGENRELQRRMEDLKTKRVSSRFVELRTKRMRDTIDISTDFAMNPGANDYTCAEQAIFDFFHHPHLRHNMQSLVSSLGIVTTVIVNICTTLFSLCSLWTIVDTRM